jgi:hypothetical protein
MGWSGKWIGPAYDPRADIGIFAFRRKFHLDEVPSSVTVRVSADNRYKLLVNGQIVGLGPQRGDLDHWFFDTHDIAPYLHAGENTLVAFVWNFGYFAPMAQVTLRTSFLLDDTEHGLSTPEHWEVAKVHGWDFEMMGRNIRNFYIDIGPGESLDGQSLSSWTEISDDATQPWKTPNTIRGASSRGTTYEPFWALVPRSIPHVRYDKSGVTPLVRHGYLGDPTTEDPKNPLAKDQGIDAAHPLLLDFEQLLCAYPRFAFTGPVGTTIMITYGEAMWTPKGDKGHRGEVSGKELRGYQDKVVLGPGTTHFEPLWFRTFRFMELEADGPVSLQSFENRETGYPYHVDSSFDTDVAIVKPLWDVSVRTAERCAGETYYDCPYYEQLQYAGDTRIQTIIHYYLSRDRSLPRNAVEQFRWSLIDNGLTESRYPNRVTQTIPPFSLWWILMQRDALFYDRSAELGASDHLANERILAAYEAMTLDDKEPFWQFGDWVPGWDSGVPPGGARSTMHRLTLMLAQIAALDLTHKGDPKATAHGRQQLRAQFQKDYTLRSGLVAHKDDAHWHPSEHSEALCRIVQRWLGLSVSPWPNHELDAAKADRCTYYFSYYKHQAILPDDYLAQLAPWKAMIEDGLTTFAENPPPVRSDCHAWSAHPALGFLQIVAGVTSESPGWNRCHIQPRPGDLKRFTARIAHPDGDLTVEFSGDRLKIDTPVPATLVWQGKTHSITPGLFGT